MEGEGWKKAIEHLHFQLCLKVMNHRIRGSALLGLLHVEYFQLHEMSVYMM